MLVIFGIVVFIMFYLLFPQMKNRVFRLEDEEQPSAEIVEEIVETYMKMMEPVKFDSETSRSTDCLICYKEYE